MDPASYPNLAELQAAAQAAVRMNWSPYSGYRVLAAVETVDGKFYGGSNVENANYTLTKHAEEAAVLAALQDGALERNGRRFIKAIYVTSPAAPAPCGGCRQFINEFVAADAVWVGEDSSGNVQGGTFLDLLPYSFNPEKLGVED
jgi:cytidine deaminase